MKMEDFLKKEKEYIEACGFVATCMHEGIEESGDVDRFVISGTLVLYPEDSTCQAMIHEVIPIPFAGYLGEAMIKHLPKIAREALELQREDLLNLACGLLEKFKHEESKG